MKTLILPLLLLAAALPAAAVQNGGCCASVKNTCISKCTQQGGCTGKGDCRLAFASAGNAAGVDLESPAGRVALATLPEAGRTELRRLVGKEAQTLPGERPMQDTPQGLTSAPGVPTLTQLGGAGAKVPMKHGSCGLDCGIHVLAVSSGNLGVPVRVGMTCPAAVKVDGVEFQLAGQGVTALVQGNTQKSSFSKEIKVQPFSKAELEAACQKALGGSWPLPDLHHNTEATVETELQETIRVWGHCTGWADKAVKEYPVKLTVTCSDQSFPPPPVG